MTAFSRKQFKQRINGALIQTRPVSLKPVFLSRWDALKDLAEFGSHSFIAAERALDILQPFGVEQVHVELVRANTGDPKGLTTGSGIKNEPVEGVSGYNLARIICVAVGGDTAEGDSKMGRGYKFRAYLDQIRGRLDRTEVTGP